MFKIYRAIKFVSYLCLMTTDLLIMVFCCCTLLKVHNFQNSISPNSFLISSIDLCIHFLHSNLASSSAQPFSDCPRHNRQTNLAVLPYFHLYCNSNILGHQVIPKLLSDGETARHIIFSVRLLSATTRLVVSGLRFLSTLNRSVKNFRSIAMYLLLSSILLRSFQYLCIYALYLIYVSNL